MSEEDLKPDHNIEQHSIIKSIFLHLFPGLLITLFFLVVLPMSIIRGGTSYLAILLAILLVLIPFELGYLFYQGKKKNGRFSLKGIILYREKIPVGQYLVIIPALYFFIVILSLLLSPVRTFIIDTFFSWVPSWVFLEHFLEDPSAYSRSSLILTLFLGLLLSGFGASVVEELYFRGYLLPRISRFKMLAPLMNVALFSLYHFFSPWQYPAIFLGFLPVAYVIYLKKNIYLGIIIHCLLNGIGVLRVLFMILRYNS
jgi:membrane protease YdiL (CAAX protease family)